MQNYILFEDSTSLNFLPLTYTRPIFELRLGIDTIKEKWEYFLQKEIGVLAFNYLRYNYKNYQESNDTIFINGKIIPDEIIVNELVKSLEPGQGYVGSKGEILAFRYQTSFLLEMPDENYFEAAYMPLEINFYDFAKINLLRTLDRIPDLFLMNGEQIRLDFQRITQYRRSCDSNDRYTIVYNPGNIFIEEGVKIRSAILNAEDGPIYIGSNAMIMEGSIIHGTHAICEGSQIMMGAKLKGDSTIGPFCKVGGEVSNSNISDYSNKVHDGFLGNSIIGRWCNLGANTNVSNLKNSYSHVKIYNHARERMIDTGLQFCGLIMGDYSRTGINTMFNTGTTVDVCSNVFGTGFPAKHIASFCWNNTEENDVYQFEKAIITLEKMKARRNKELTVEDRLILLAIFEKTAKYRANNF